MYFVSNSFTHKLETTEGTAYIILVEDYPGKLARVDIINGRNGTNVRALCSALSELITLALPHYSLTVIAAQISMIMSDKASLRQKIFTTPDAVSRVLLAYIQECNIAEHVPSPFPDWSRLAIRDSA